MIKKITNYRVNALVLVFLSCTPQESKTISSTGVYTVSFEGEKKVSSGTALLTEKSLIIQFEQPEHLEILSVGFAVDNKIIHKEIEWICALMKDLRMIRCSTDPEIFESKEMFVDEKYFTVRFSFFKDVKLHAKKIDLLIKTTNGITKVSVTLKQEEEKPNPKIGS
jgi:hypothetical protein